MPDDEASRPGSGASASDDREAVRRLAVLEQRIRRAGGFTEDRPVDDARRLAEIEQDLLSVTRDLTRSDPDLADDCGHPVLADLGRWRSRCAALGLDAERARAGDLLAELVGDEADHWCEAAARAVADGSPDQCFQLLSEATVLEWEATVRRPEAPGRTLLENDRGALREAFVRKLETAPPDEAMRERWTTDLLDRADVVLTGIDDLGPAPARAQLGLAAADLRWYLTNVETKRGSRRKRLRRKWRRLRAEIQERRLQGRLEGIFGAKAVGRFEQLVLALIFLVLGLLAIEAIFDLSSETLYWFTVADTLACVVFLLDFFGRLWLVKGKWGWFARHALIDFLPSIPFGLLTLHAAGPDPIRAGRAIRLLRLTRVARYVRVLMPVIRIVRAFGFLTRGLDRVVRHYGHLLNRDVILYPTREENVRARATRNETVARLRRLDAEMTDLWEDLLVSTHGALREDVARMRIEALSEARRGGLTHRPPLRGARVAVTREVPAEMLLRRLERTTAEAIEADMGADFVARVARIVRLFSKPPLRWIPFLGRLFPRLGPAMSDAEAVAAGARHASKKLRRYHARWFRFADLYGTVTPAEFVARVGSTMIKSAFRPAYRLLLIGGVFLLVELLLLVLPWELLHTIGHTIGPLVGDTLLLLGGICFLVLAVGWWLRRIGSQATVFYEQVALAQFLPLMESVKGRSIERDAAVLSQTVVGPESLLHGEAPEARAVERRARFVAGVKAWLLQAHAGGDATGAFDAMERTVLLYRDGMDGGLLHESDTRTTNQLLGNPALRYLRLSAGCVNRRERKAFRALDLEHQRRTFGGPYFWFSLITRAVAQAAAGLIVEYNRNAIPLVELPVTGPDECARYETWLEGKDAGDEEVAEAAVTARDAQYATAAFTALHFLDDDPHRDREVTRRFGRPVLLRLHRDRRRLFRRIFGTYPLHTRAHEERVVNLYRLYEDWLAGGRALLLPLRGLWGGAKWIARVVGWVAAAVKEVRHPRAVQEYVREVEADFATAVRKIDRMRGPVVRASLWLRARTDCEYLGVRLPGTFRTGIEGAGVERDLDFLDAPIDLRMRVEEERDLAQADVRRLAKRIDQGLFERIAGTLGLPPDALGREHLRAAVFAYRADIAGVRSLLSASAILQETSAEAPYRRLLEGNWWLHPRLRWAFSRWWKANGRGGRHIRKAAWRAVLNDANGAGRALRVWARLSSQEAVAEGERRLTELLRYPGRLSGQLVTLRAVQTLALIDVLNYRTHVWRLGEYEADGDDAGCLLTLASSVETYEQTSRDERRRTDPRVAG